MVINILIFTSIGAYFVFDINKLKQKVAATEVLNSLHKARLLALIDSSSLLDKSFTSIYNFTSTDIDILLSKPIFFSWQIQFHLSGLYTQNSLSIYRDTPRIARTTNYDKRPMAGDILALNASTLECLSGYNNSNITKFCQNNSLNSMRLLESFGVRKMDLSFQKSCKERNTFRIYFDNLSHAFCGRDALLLDKDVVVTIGNQSIFISKATGYSFFVKNLVQY